MYIFPTHNMNTSIFLINFTGSPAALLCDILDLVLDLI